MGARSDRLATSLQRSVAGQLQKLFPNQFITVTEVEVTSDLRQATVWVSLLEAKNACDILGEIEHQLPRLRSQLAQDVQLRHVPRLAVKHDQRGQAVDDLTRRLRSDEDNG